MRRSRIGLTIAAIGLGLLSRHAGADTKHHREAMRLYREMLARHPKAHGRVPYIVELPQGDHYSLEPYVPLGYYYGCFVEKPNGTRWLYIWPQQPKQMPPLPGKITGWLRVQTPHPPK